MTSKQKFPDLWFLAGEPLDWNIWDDYLSIPIKSPDKHNGVTLNWDFADQGWNDPEILHFLTYRGDRIDCPKNWIVA